MRLFRNKFVKLGRINFWIHDIECNPIPTKSSHSNSAKYAKSSCQKCPDATLTLMSACVNAILQTLISIPETSLKQGSSSVVLQGNAKIDYLSLFCKLQSLQRI